MKLYKTLEDLTNEGFLKCLNKYNENYHFIEWLRKKAPGMFSFLIEFLNKR